MKHIGFTGSRLVLGARLVHTKLEYLLQELQHQHGQLTVHHGDCLGMDDVFHNCALKLGLWIVIHPPLDTKYQANCAGVLVPSLNGSDIRYPKLEVLQRKGYLVRNHDIVDACKILIASPKEIHREERRSGTWATVRYARKEGKEILFI